MVTGADGHTAAGDIEITMTCVFDLELTSKLLEDSFHSCKLESCDLSNLAPSTLWKWCSTIKHFDWDLGQ